MGRREAGPRVAAFLGRAVEPPLDVAVDNAVRLLEDIGALEAGSEELTLLGRHLAALPLPPRIGKLLLYGILFRCLDPVLTVACCMAYRWAWSRAQLPNDLADIDVFQSSPEKSRTGPYQVCAAGQS